MSLKDSPTDVMEVLTNLATPIENLFNIVKFQMMHYKRVLSLSCQRILSLEKENASLRKYVFTNIISLVILHLKE